MSEENVNVIRRWYEQQQDAETFFGLLDPHVVFINYASAPESEPFVGHEGVREWARSFRETFGDFRIDVTEITDAGGGQIVVAQRVHGAGTSSGAPVERRMATLYTLVNGKIVRAQGFETLAQALEAVGLSE